MNIYNLFILFISIGCIENASIQAEDAEDYDDNEMDLVEDEEYQEDDVMYHEVEMMRKKERRAGRLIKGGDCEYIKLTGITANSGCGSGNKFVIKQQTGVRKQFLVLNGEPIMAFINR